MNTVSYSAGIDVAKGHLDLYLRPSGHAERFSNDAPGHRKLINVLRKHRVSLIVLEATGGYERAAVKAMVAADLPVHVAQPQTIRAFAKSLNLRAKNDQIDSNVNAQFAEERAGKLKVIESIDPVQEQLAALAVRRSQLVEMQTMEQNRVQQVADKRAIKNIKQTLKFLAKQIKDVEKQMDDIIKENEKLREKSAKLQETKGVGPQTARLLLACLPELGKTSSKRLNALVGVAPYDNESGEHKGHRFIAGGRKLVRNGLYMACMSAAHSNDVIKPYYVKLVARGLAHKSAMMACIRKLLNYLNEQLQPDKSPKTA